MKLSNLKRVQQLLTERSYLTEAARLIRNFPGEEWSLARNLTSEGAQMVISVSIIQAGDIVRCMLHDVESDLQNLGVDLDDAVAEEAAPCAAS